MFPGLLGMMQCIVCLKFMFLFVMKILMRTRHLWEMRQDIKFRQFVLRFRRQNCTETCLAQHMHLSAWCWHLGKLSELGASRSLSIWETEETVETPEFCTRHHLCGHHLDLLLTETAHLIDLIALGTEPQRITHQNRQNM